MTAHRQWWLAAACAVSGFIATGASGASAPWVGRFTARRVITASSPDNTYELLRRFYDSANSSIRISVYQLDNPFIGDVLEEVLDRKRGRVSVEILVEGGPIPKIPAGELYIADRLTRKGARVYFYDLDEGRNARRFRYFHAKYGIVDGTRVIVGSANYGNNGHPVDDSFGNREWEIVLDDPQAAGMFEAAFRNDWSKKDEWTPYGGSDRYRLSDPDYRPDRSPRAGGYELDLTPVEDRDVSVETVFAPDNSLSRTSGMLGALRAARATVDVEQLSFETYWGDKPYNPEREESPMMKVILDLAREGGRQIRILLNDDGIFRDPDGPRLTDWLSGAPALWAAADKEKPPRDNHATVEYLTRTARREGLAIAARLFNYRQCNLGVLHNKGMIVDRTTTLVGSLNWGESALKFNREAGVVVRSTPVARYYQQAFDYDWRCSAQGRSRSGPAS